MASPAGSHFLDTQRREGREGRGGKGGKERGGREGREWEERRGSNLLMRNAQKAAGIHATPSIENYFASVFTHSALYTQ